MLRRMAGANFNAPLPPINLDHIILLNAMIGLWQRVNMLTKAPKPGAIPLQCLIIKSGGAIKSNAFFGRFFTRIARHSAAHQIIRARHIKPRIKAIDQPTGQTDMVGMQMRDNDFFQFFTGHEATEQLFPMRA